MTLTEKASYIKGLIEGLGIDKESKEGKIYDAIIDLLNDLALSCEDNEAGIDELYELADEIDYDLGALEEDIYGEDDGCDCGCDCDCDEYMLICPNCQKEVPLTYENLINDDTVTCPFCNEILELDFDDECDCDDCCEDKE